MSLCVLKPGLLDTVQDAGRPGHAALGIGRAGAMDLPAWQLANALVGNRHGEAALECTVLGPELRFTEPGWFAVTGALDQLQLDGRWLPAWCAIHAPAGATVRLGPLRQGCRAYLAVRGGLLAPRLLGSASTDLHAGLGRPLAAGEHLAIGPVDTALPALPRLDRLRHLPWQLDPRPWRHRHRPLALLPGSHMAQLDEASRQALFSRRWQLGHDSNRTGCRLHGEPLRLRQPLELVSEGSLPGVVQLPPSGLPIVLAVEAPVSGGYPRIGQLARVDLPSLAQRAPGDDVSFQPCTMAQAWQRWQWQQQRLQLLCERIHQRLREPWHEPIDRPQLRPG